MRVKQFFFSLLIISSSVILISSCKKIPGTATPVVTLTSPADTLVIHAGDTVLIKGTVTDNKNLHELYFSFMNTSDSAVLLSEHPYVHGAKEHKFSYTWITSTTPSVYQFVVEAYDHDNHSAKKEFLFTVN
jgi:hypothetical protein